MFDEFDEDVVCFHVWTRPSFTLKKLGTLLFSSYPIDVGKLLYFCALDSKLRPRVDFIKGFAQYAHLLCLALNFCTSKKLLKSWA